MITDPGADQNGAPVSNTQFDIRSVSFAEPNWADGVRRLTITLKVDNLSSLPQNGRWNVQFTHGTPAVKYFVAMNTLVEDSTPTFTYGVVGTTTTTQGDAESSSSYNADGTITIVINNQKVGNPGAGTALTAINAYTQQTVGTSTASGNVSMDTTPAAGPTYTMVAADQCPIVDEDGDGVVDGNDFCPNTPAGTEVKENGCPLVSGDTDGDGISDEDDDCPMTPLDTPVDANGCPTGAAEIHLHFHGNSHDDCTGNGPADDIACGGPFLYRTATLDSAAAAHYEDNGALITTNGNGVADPNFDWIADESTTIQGPIVIKFWASCNASCVQLGAVWEVLLYKNGTEAALFSDVPANPETGDLPSLLTMGLTIKPEDAITVAEGDKLALVIRGGYVDSNANTRVYYDSTQACAPGGTGPCDSFVVFNAKDTDGDGVADVLDQCQGTPPGTTVDANGCPAVPASCTVGAAAAARAGVPLSGAIKIDAPVLAEWKKLGLNDQYGAFVQFFNRGTREQQDLLLSSMGLTKLQDFRRYTTSVYVEGPVSAFQKLIQHPWIMRIEHNHKLRYLDATQSWTMRVRIAQETVSGGPYYDANGDILTGKGVTLGIIDSGMFGAHPDYGGLARISHNYKLVSPVGGPVYYQDVGIGDSENGGGGHGTHVSGIVAGGGQQSDGGYPDPTVVPFIPGTFTSASPDAKIIHWGNGAVLFVLSVDLAYQHLLDNIGLPEFRTLKAVNNSYGDGAGVAYNPDDTGNKLISQIVSCGVNMVFAAGNDGGDGTADNTSSTCKDPTPGVICVASYNDQGTGTLSGPLSTFSSRGKQGKPAEYPDVAAPGDLSTSTCAQATPTQAICTGGDDSEAETEWQPWYGTISGTSMASPNVVSAIGVLAQANPNLTPAEMEQLIQRNARKIGGGYEPDPQHAGSTIHFGYGAGLVDVQAALEDMGINKLGLPAVDTEWTIFDQDSEPDVTEPAANAVKLTMQNVNLEGITGVMYRLTVEDAAGFTASTSLNYRVENNVRGDHYRTTIVATPDGVEPGEPSANNTAVATLAVREDNVIRFFVPYSRLGYPPINEPIHNIRVVVAGPAGEIDYAPAPFNGTVQTASVRPMYGRPFTIRLVPGVPPPESSCILPGIRTNLDSAFDSTTDNAAHEIESVHFAEPLEIDAVSTADKLVATLKVGSLAVVPPNTIWLVRFDTPTPPSDALGHFVGLSTADGAERFVYGTYTVEQTPAASVSTYQIVGDIDAASSYEADGTITLVADKSLFGALNVGDVLSNTLARVGPLSSNEGPIAGGAQDDTGAGAYTLRGSDICLLEPPIASLLATAPDWVAPVTVTFDGSGSVVTADGASIVSYTFDFGDGNDPVTQDSPTIQHTYMLAGEYTATLTVLDSNGIVSETVEALIEILPANIAPIADAGLGFEVTEGTGVLLAGRGTDVNGDTLTYQWTQVSGPTVAIGNDDMASASFTAPQVAEDADLVFRLTVDDGEGGQHFDDVTVRVLNTTPDSIGNNLAGGLPPASLLWLGALALMRRRRHAF